MRKIPPFCPLRQDSNFDIEDCPHHQALQKQYGTPDEIMCRKCIEQEVDSNGTN